MKKKLKVLLIYVMPAISFAQMNVFSDGSAVFWKNLSVSNASDYYSSDLFVYNTNPGITNFAHSLIRGWYTQSQAVNPAMLMLSSTSDSYFTVLANGKVGIMNVTPTVALEVGYAGTNHQVKVNGTIVLGSDERLKENIADISGSIQKLQRLRSVSYNFKELKDDAYSSKEDEVITDKDGKKIKIPSFKPKSNPATLGRKQYGFLAQDVEKLFPELVYKDPEGLMSVDYIGMIPLLLDAIKEQQQQIDYLTKQLPAKMQSPIGVSVAPPEIHQRETTTPVLYQNLPNPFSQSTQIKYSLPKGINRALLCVYDMNGKQLKQYELNERGEGVQTISGSEFSAGIYLYGLIVDGQPVDVKKMVLTE